MDKQEIQERIKVMQAWIDGAEIEWQVIGSDNWHLVDSPCELFTWGEGIFRIKPKAREIWVTMLRGNHYVADSCRALPAGGKPIKYREVLDDE